MYDLDKDEVRDPRRTTRSSFTREALSGAGTAQPTRSASTLEEIAERIHMACTRLDDVTDLMMDHADRVHGSSDELAGGANGVEPALPGQVSRIFQALERLDGALNRNAYAAGRNTNIA